MPTNNHCAYTNKVFIHACDLVENYLAICLCKYVVYPSFTWEFAQKMAMYYCLS